MGSGSKSGGGGGVQVTMLPEAKKMVQSMKEIVSNFPESEIYAVLKECNMDPDAAVQRLLSLDTFHEVKSRKERRKETKETQDARSWGNNTSSNNGVKGANERNLGRHAAVLTSPNDYGNGAYKRENGSVSPPLYSAPSSTSCTTGKTLNRQPLSQGVYFGADDARHSTRTADGMSSSQQYPGVQSAWSGTASGLVSMADIVKMGRSHGKTSLQPTDMCHDVVASYQSDYGVKAHHISATSQPDQCFSDPSYAHQKINKSTNNVDHHVHYEEWPAIEQLATTTESSSLDVSTIRDADIYTDKSNSCGDGGNMSRNLLLRDVQESNGGVAREDLRFGVTKTASASNLIKISGATSHYDNGTIKDTVSQNAAEHTYERLEGNDSDETFQSSSVPKAGDDIIRVSSAAVELEHLNLGKEDHVKSPTGNKCIVVFPSNLQALAGDCSHLSFGTYKSRNAGAFSGPPTLDLKKINMEEASRAVDGSSTGGLDTRYFGYDADFPTESYSSYKATTDARIYDLPVSTQPELMQETISEVTCGHEYMSPLSVSDSSFENIQQSSALPFMKPDQTIMNQTSLLNEVLGYSNPRQTDLLATARDSDYLQLAYLASQQLPSRYGSAVSTIGSPAISMAEVAKSGTLLPEQSSQTLPGVIGHELKQHLANPYPQSSLNVEQLANIIGYPSALPQSQYKPHAQESYQGGSSYQSLSDMKHSPQHYNSGASLSNLPLPNANASGYANFGNSANVPGNFLHNPSATNKNSYEFLLSQYKDANHFNPTLGQNDNGLTWDYATNSRTMSSVPNSAYDSFQAQNQQHLGYKQTPQASQHYAALGYQEPYHSLTGMPQEYQRNDPTLYSQISSSKEQLWQQRY